MSAPTIPFLPGNTFIDVTKSDFRKSHTLDFINGYAEQKKPSLGIGLEELAVNDKSSPEELLSAIANDPFFTYGEKRYHAKPIAPRFVPAHVAFDKVVLKFDGYYKQTLHESVEQYLLRKVTVHYFVEDDSISVVEPPVENSGIPQGVLIKRHRIPKTSTTYYTAKDFNVGINMTFYGKTFRIISCDSFTKEYLTGTEKITLNPSEPCPEDPFAITRARPARNVSAFSVAGHAIVKNDKLKKFLEFDRKVLRFFAIWDDRESMFGERREFILHYYLVDDSVEVREVQGPNSGRDPNSVMLRRQQLPKVPADLGSIQEAPKYTWKEFTIGSVINILGRPFFIRDTDEYTSQFFQANNIGNNKAPIQVLKKAPAAVKIETPPYNGYGSVDDSLGSCKYLVLKPPKKDFVKMLENEKKVLRFTARIEPNYPEDKERRFVISYYLADETMSIYEPPQRNSGILGGKFMERTRVVQPHSSLSDPKGPVYYDAKQLSLGASLTILNRKFIILNADEYVFNYFESGAYGQLAHSNKDAVLAKVHGKWSAAVKEKLAKAFAAADAKNTGVLSRGKVIELAQSIIPQALSEHETVTLCRAFEQESRQVNYKSLLEL